MLKFTFTHLVQMQTWHAFLYVVKEQNMKQIQKRRALGCGKNRLSVGRLVVQYTIKYVPAMYH